MAIFFFKCQVFGNFLTVKWQFSGGSGVNPAQSDDKSEIPEVNYEELLLIFVKYENGVKWVLVKKGAFGYDWEQ